MDKQRWVRLTLIGEKKTINLLTWMREEIATSYAHKMTARGYVVVKQYR